MAPAQTVSRADESESVAAARRGNERAFQALTEPYIGELRVHCYRMLGSIHEAEDALQETLLKAWRGVRGFDGRSGIRTWLYKIATNACLDMLRQSSRRVLPNSRTLPADPSRPPGPLVAEPIWLEPFPDRLLPHATSEPEARYTTRESVELAFLVVIQRLAPKQRAVLLLRDVLGWRMSEIANLLDTTVPAAKSALQRARALVRTEGADRRSRPSPAEEKQLLSRYVRAFEDHDIPALLALIHEDAVMTMPPDAAWFEGRAAIIEFLDRWVFGVRPHLRAVPTSANGQPGLCIYEAQDESSPFKPLAVQVLTISESLLSAITGFVDPSLLEFFDPPRELPPERERLP